MRRAETFAKLMHSAIYAVGNHEGGVPEPPEWLQTRCAQFLDEAWAGAPCWRCHSCDGRPWGQGAKKCRVELLHLDPPTAKVLFDLSAKLPGLVAVPQGGNNARPWVELPFPGEGVEEDARHVVLHAEDAKQFIANVQVEVSGNDVQKLTPKELKVLFNLMSSENTNSRVRVVAGHTEVNVSHLNIPHVLHEQVIKELLPPSEVEGHVQEVKRRMRDMIKEARTAMRTSPVIESGPSGVAGNQELGEFIIQHMKMLHGEDERRREHDHMSRVHNELARIDLGKRKRILEGLAEQHQNMADLYAREARHCEATAELMASRSSDLAQSAAEAGQRAAEKKAQLESLLQLHGEPGTW